jgi:hypothetical protein
MVLGSSCHVYFFTEHFHSDPATAGLSLHRVGEFGIGPMLDGTGHTRSAVLPRPSGGMVETPVEC